MRVGLFAKLLFLVLLLSLTGGCGAPPAQNLDDTKGDDTMRNFGDVKIGETVCFGTFDHDGKSETERKALPWRVLAVEGDKALLITVDGIDSQQYNDQAIETDWERCSLRRWLNGKFLGEAFTGEETAQIAVTEGDRLFLLSIAEAERYFSSDEDRTCKPTALARMREVYVDEEAGTCAWWLKDGGSVPESAALVTEFGLVDRDGDGVYCEGTAVRPAMWIKLS